MLLEYDVSNFKSFRNEAYLDMRPAKNRVLKRFPNNFTALASGQKVLKSSVIVGENAGGKSNFVQSVQFMKNLMTRNDLPIKSDLSCVHTANVTRAGTRINLTASDTSQSFQVEIALADIIYRYSLTLDVLGIIAEKLDYSEGSDKPFENYFAAERARLDVSELAEQASYGDALTLPYQISLRDEQSEALSHIVQTYNDSGRQITTLYLVLLATLGSPHCQSVLRWFTEILFIVAEPTPEFLVNVIDKTRLCDIMGSDKYLDIVRLIDASISDFAVDGERPFAESRIERTSGTGRKYSRLAKDDSTGVRRFLLWAVCIYLTVYENKVVVADEIDSCINPVLSDRVIAFIQGSAHTGQFVFTTHNIFNLTLRTFMKEQINIVTKDVETLESTLYSLADFPDIRYDVNKELYEFYMQGALGGIADA